MAPNPLAPYADRHVNLAGPGDARPTALQIVEDENLINGLQGKVIIVTGAASGIGIETARALHETGAKVYLAVRNVAKGQEVANDILSKSSNKAPVEILEVELSDLASVRACAKEFLGKEKQLNLLINNAGVMAIPERQLSKDGYELQFATNHLGHFLLTHLLTPTLLSSASPTFPSRVVAVSSSGHKTARPDFSNLQLATGYSPWVAYAYSKTANIWMANQLTRLYSSQHLYATSLNPGGIYTNLQKYVSQELKDKWAADKDVLNFLKNPEQGAATTVWAAVGKVWSDKGGEYLEDLAVQEVVQDSSNYPGGMAKWGKDEEGEKKMWEVSKELVGVKDE